MVKVRNPAPPPISDDTRDLIIQRRQAIAADDKESYLTGHKQCVQVPGGERSTLLPINIGIFQGSCLGPMLYNIASIGAACYVPSEVNGSLVRMARYADDTQLVVSGPKERLPEIQTALEGVLDTLATYFLQNGMKINAAKTEMMVAGGRSALQAAERDPLPAMDWGLFKSEHMELYQLFLQTEAVYNCVSELGELGAVQFRDLNPNVNAFQRKFVNEVRRCDEMERKLKYFEREINKDEIPMLDTGESPEAPQPREMIDLEASFEKLENELKEVNGNSETLKKNYLELTELKHILLKAQHFFDEKETQHVQEGIQQSLVANDEVGRQGASGQLNFVAGVIKRERVHAFELMLWRACRGNVFLRQAEIEEPLEDPVSM
ncbi:V-type proton ATPase subunit a isoform 1 [Amphibalanus amphitrite]|uniref:V-type proton ATPase subunit a n=1 Tax=Amphibalanus amphitrite TaxID=1232801 RepID=A0A6A4VVI9_AMPAM|nr:V-type proton ATPase subunit a isoform 1 [Amphibalanus amphitrite]